MIIVGDGWMDGMGGWVGGWVYGWMDSFKSGIQMHDLLNIIII